jgi:chromosome segregation ATPase
VWQTRQARIAASPPAQAALNDGYKILFGEMRAELEHLRVEVSTLRAQVDDCERRHDEAQERIAHLESVVERRRVDVGPPDPPGTERRHGAEEGT